MSKIEWTDKTLNLVGGCDKVSPGCDNCYAIPMSFRQEKFHLATLPKKSKKVFIKQLDLGGKYPEKDINKFPIDLQLQEFPS